MNSASKITLSSSSYIESNGFAISFCDVATCTYSNITIVLFEFFLFNQCIKVRLAYDALLRYGVATAFATAATTVAT